MIFPDLFVDKYNSNFCMIFVVDLFIMIQEIYKGDRRGDPKMALLAYKSQNISFGALKNGSSGL